jgi:predicted DNA-binding protein
MKRTNIYLPEQVLKKLRALSKKVGVSVAELVRRALDDYLKDAK